MFRWCFMCQRIFYLLRYHIHFQMISMNTIYLSIVTRFTKKRPFPISFITSYGPAILDQEHLLLAFCAWSPSSRPYEVFCPSFCCNSSSVCFGHASHFSLHYPESPFLHWLSTHDNNSKQLTYYYIVIEVTCYISYLLSICILIVN